MSIWRKLFTLGRAGAHEATAAVVDGLDAGAGLENALREQADTVLRGLSESYPFGDHLLNMSVSIGIAVFPGDGETAEQRSEQREHRQGQQAEQGPPAGAMTAEAREALLRAARGGEDMGRAGRGAGHGRVGRAVTPVDAA